MTRRLALAALALFLLAPLGASAKTNDAAVKGKLESAVKLLEGLVKKAAKDTPMQATFRTGVIAARAAQVARVNGQLDDALALANASHQAGENKTPPVLSTLEKTHGKWVKPAVAAVSSNWATLSKDWKKQGLVLPENLFKPTETIPDMIMKPSGPTSP